MNKRTPIKRTAIKKTGNGAYIPVTRDMLTELDAEIGTEVTITIEDGRMTVAKADSNYERTRKAVREVAARYPLTLKLFGQ